jgi:hypothetical protein
VRCGLPLGSHGIYRNTLREESYCLHVATEGCRLFVTGVKAYSGQYEEYGNVILFRVIKLIKMNMNIQDV